MRFVFQIILAGLAVVLLQACASTAKRPDPNVVETDIVLVRDVTPLPPPVVVEKNIVIKAKPDTSLQQIHNFVEYMGCRIKKTVSKGARLFLIDVPSHLDIEQVLSGFRKHPWITNARIETREESG